MTEIDGKKFELVELSGRKYQALMDRFDKDFGDDWRSKGGIKIASALLAACLKAEDGELATEDQVLDLPIRKINQLSAEAMALNGMTANSGAELEKN